VTDLHAAKISVPGSTRGARVYPLRTWRLVLEGLRNPAWRDLSAVPRHYALSGSTCQHDHSLLRRHGDQATRIRAAINPGFTRDSVEPWRAGVRARAGELAAGLQRGLGDADLVTGFCEPLVAEAVAITTGLDGGQWAFLRELTEAANALVLSPGDHATIGQGQEDLRAFCAPVVARMRAERGRAERAGRAPDPGLISRAVAALDRAGLDPAEVYGTLQPVFSGFPSAIPILAAMAFEALCLPDVLDQCRDNPDLVPAAVWEHLRRNCHFPFALPGVNTHPIQAGHGVIPPGSVVVPMIADAEHDQTRTPDPDRYDLHRRRRAILAFGAGVHVCPGKAWMLMVLEEAARALAQRQLRLAVTPGKVALQNGGLMPGVPARIPVRPANAVSPAGAVRPADAVRPPVSRTYPVH
jgi:cytochrome P450